MSKRSVEFLEQWVEDNIHAGAFLDEKGDPRPKQYADSCAVEAKTRGISRKELEEDVGSLTEYMTEAVNAAADREVNRLVAKDA